MRILIAIVALMVFAAPARANFLESFGGAAVGGVAGSLIGNMINRSNDERQQQPQPQYYHQYPQPQQYAPPPQPVDPIAYCMQRFRSYNPETGLYVGYDRQYHRCP